MKRAEFVLIKTVGFAVNQKFSHLIPLVEDPPQPKMYSSPGQTLFGPNESVRVDGRLTGSLEKEGYVLVNVDQRRRPGTNGRGSIPVIFRMYQLGGQPWLPAEPDCHRWLNWALRRPWGGCGIYHNQRGTADRLESMINIDLVAPRKVSASTDHFHRLGLYPYIWVEDPTLAKM